MNSDRDDDRIDRKFRGLKAHTERPGAIPDFAAMMAKARIESERPAGIEMEARPRRDFVHIGGWMSLAAAAAAAGLLLLNPASSDADLAFERLVSTYTADVSSGAWRSPTSGLLETPGLDLGSVPSIGGMIRGLDRTDAPTPDGPEGRDS